MLNEIIKNTLEPNAKLFIEQYKSGKFPSPMFGTMCKNKLAELIVEDHLQDIFLQYPEIYLAVSNLKCKELAPKDIYARIFYKCATDLESIDPPLRTKCLFYLDYQVSRVALRHEIIQSMSIEEVTELLAIIYSRVVHIPSAAVYAIWFSELSHLIDTRRLIRSVRQNNENASLRVKTLVEKYL